MCRKNHQFRKATTFNRHDTHLSVGPRGRIQVNNGVDVRCDLIIRALEESRSRYYTVGEDEGVYCISTREMLEYAREQHPLGSTYTMNDITYALNVLVGMGLVCMWEPSRGSGRHTGYILTYNPDKVRVRLRRAA
jgi:hypothetical protein